MYSASCTGKWSGSSSSSSSSGGAGSSSSSHDETSTSGGGARCDGVAPLWFDPTSGPSCCWEAIAAMTYARKWRGCVVAVHDGMALGIYPVVTSSILGELIARSDAPQPRYLRALVASHQGGRLPVEEQRYGARARVPRRQVSRQLGA